MELHDDPQALVEKLAKQHWAVLGEVHGDIAARLAEVPDRFVDQGGDPRPITVSCTLLETLLFSRWRRQNRDSTLKAVKGNGFGILLLDGKGMRIPVRKHPRRWDGTLLETVPYVPGGEQCSLEDELGHPIGGLDGIAEPQGYRPYVLWWPGNQGLGGAVLAAGVLTDDLQVLYAKTPLPPPVMEQRAVSVPLQVARMAAVEQVRRRRDEDFAGIEGVDEDREGSAPQQSS